MQSSRATIKVLALASVSAIIAACGDREDEELTTTVEPAPDTAPAVETASGQWFYKESNGYPWAGFGPPRSEAVFVIACRNGQIVFQHASSESEKISIRLAESREDIDMEPAGGELPMTEGALPANHPFVQRIHDSEGPMIVTAGGSAMALPADGSYRRVIRACAGGA